MIKKLLALGALPGLVLFAAACDVEGPPGEDDEGWIEEETETDEQAIVGGSPDTTNLAVAYIETSGGGACSATIIAKDGSVGYALTAAHCFRQCGGSNSVGTVISWASNLNNATQSNTKNISSTVVHPSYNACTGDRGNDFAIVSFGGASAAPVIPAAAPANDNLQVGSQVEHSGYGLMNSGNSLVGSDIRRHAFGNVSQLFSNAFRYEQSWATGGPCNGDSGGPQLAGGYVVGVTSNGDEICNDFGWSGRVSFVYNSFIAPNISGGGGGGANSCQGICGQQAPGGCYCDDACFMYGDCCADVCDACPSLSECAPATTTGTGTGTGTGMVTSTDTGTGTSTDTTMLTGTDTTLGTDTGTGTGEGGKKKGDGGDDTTTTSCAVTPGSTSGSPYQLALLGLAGALIAGRRRRR